MNPYKPASDVSPSIAIPHRAATLSRRRIAWNAALALVALVLYGDSYPRFARKLSRLLASRFDDIYALSDIASVANMFTPAIALLSLSTLFFEKRGPALRLFLALPMFAILMDRIPPRVNEYTSCAIYVVFASSILITGIGWPVVIRRFDSRLWTFARENPDGA